MSNRKARRAKAQDESFKSEIPLAQPSREKPEEKTLLEIAAERQLLNGKGDKSTEAQPTVVTTKINPDGSISHVEDGNSEVSQESSWLDVILYSVSLLTLYFTFTFLVHHQYASSPPAVLPLLSSTFISLTPVTLVCLVAILHPNNGHPFVQALFGLASIAAGIEIVRISNDEAYLAVMQKAPALGVIWVWAAVESKWEVAFGTTLLVGSWTWLKGYSLY